MTKRLRRESGSLHSLEGVGAGCVDWARWGTKRQTGCIVANLRTISAQFYNLFTQTVNDTRHVIFYNADWFESNERVNRPLR